MTLTLAEKVPTFSPIGFAAVATLMMLGVGYAFRARLAPCWAGRDRNGFTTAMWGQIGSAEAHSEQN